MRRPYLSVTVTLLTVLVASTGCSPPEADDPRATTPASGSGTVESADPGAQDLPALVDLGASAGAGHSTVTLSFEPGRGSPSAEVEVSEDATLTRPGSGKPVELAGDRALDVSIAGATVGEVAAIHPGGPTIAEVRVLGFFEGRANVGIGVHGDGPLDPRVDYDAGAHEITIGVPNPARGSGEGDQGGQDRLTEQQVSRLVIDVVDRRVQVTGHTEVEVLELTEGVVAVDVTVIINTNVSNERELETGLRRAVDEALRAEVDQRTDVRVNVGVRDDDDGNR